MPGKNFSQAFLVRLYRSFRLVYAVPALSSVTYSICFFDVGVDSKCFIILLTNYPPAGHFNVSSSVSTFNMFQPCGTNGLEFTATDQCVCVCELRIVHQDFEKQSFSLLGFLGPRSSQRLPSASEDMSRCNVSPPGPTCLLHQPLPFLLRRNSRFEPMPARLG